MKRLDGAERRDVSRKLRWYPAYGAIRKSTRKARTEAAGFTSQREQMLQYRICYHNTRHMRRNDGVLTPMEKHMPPIFA